MTFTIKLNGKLIPEYDELSVNIDLFSPIDTFSFKIAGSYLNDFKSAPVKSKILIELNEEVILNGFIDSKSFSNSRSGLECVVSGRNNLGKLADSTNFPGIQNNFKSNMTYKEVFKTIFNPFGFRIITNISGVKNDKYLNDQLGAQLKTSQVASRCEGVLEMALRFAKRRGWFIKQSSALLDDSNSERVNVDDLKSVDTVELLVPNYNATNYKLKEEDIISYNYELNAKDQPSIVIGNSKSNDGYGFAATSTTQAVINEITGMISKLTSNNQQTFQFVQAEDGTFETAIVTTGAIKQEPEAIDSVKKYIKDNKLTKAANVDLNTQLYNYVSDISSVDPESDCIPYYYYDEYASGAAQIRIATQMKLNEFQRRYLNCNITVKGFEDSNSGKIWKINNMIDCLSIYNIIKPELLWIQRVVFNYSRSRGSTTNLTLNLPGLYQDLLK